MTIKQSEKMRSIILPLYDELMGVCRKAKDCEGCPFGCGYECGLENLRENAKQEWMVSDERTPSL